MDPVTTIGLVSSILTLVNFSYKAVNSAKEIYNSSNGLTRENSSREELIRSMRDLPSNPQSPNQSPVAPEDKLLYDLSYECQEISDKILGILEGMKMKEKSCWGAIISMGKTWRRGAMLTELEDRLDKCRNRLERELMNRWK